MKIKTLLFLFICLSLSACKDDDDPVVTVIVLIRRHG